VAQAGDFTSSSSTNIMHTWITLFCACLTLSHTFRIKTGAKRTAAMTTMLDSDGGNISSVIRSQVNESFNLHAKSVNSEIRHIGEGCTVDGGNDECIMSGLVCARPNREACMQEDSDCICLASPESRGQYSVSQDCVKDSICKACRCVNGGEEEACGAYNPWKQWNNDWTKESLFGIVDGDDFLVGMDGNHSHHYFTDNTLLDAFLVGDRKYAGTLSKDEVLVSLEAMGQMYSTESAIFSAMKNVLGACSLPTTYKLVQEARFLADSGRLSSSEQVGHRIYETQVRLLRIMAEAAKVRTNPDESKALYEMYQLAKMHKGKAKRANEGKTPFREWTETSGLALNSEMMLWTELSFSVVLISGLKAFGIALSTQQKNDWTVAWSVLGNMMGVPLEFDSYASAVSVFTAMMHGPDFYKSLQSGHQERAATMQLVNTLNKMAQAQTGKVVNTEAMELFCLSSLA